MTQKASIVSLFLASLAIAATAQAGDEGLYVGGSVGQSTFKDSARVSDGFNTQKISFDESDTSYRLFGGYMLLPFLGVETGYTNFGTPNKTYKNTAVGTVNANIDVDGWDAFVVGNLPLGPIDVFAKAGVLWVNTDSKIRFGGSTAGSGSDSDQVGAYGVGAAFGFGNLKVRTEYTTYDVSNIDDLYMLSAGLTYQF